MNLKWIYLFILPCFMIACGEPLNSDSDESEVGILNNPDGVIDIVATNSTFAFLKSDGTVKIWGNEVEKVPDGLTEVTKIFANQYAFAALKKDGSVVTWGPAGYGGDGHVWTILNRNQLKDVNPELKNVRDIAPSLEGFAALKKDGSVVAWGRGEYLDTAPLKNQLTRVKEIVGSGYGFAALKEDKTVVAWGGRDNNYRFDSVKNQLTNVKKVYRTILAFGALKENGSFVTWGKSDLGGDSSSAHIPLTNIEQVFTVDRAFAVLKGNGRVTAWGSSKAGGGISSAKDQLFDIKKVVVAGDTFPQSVYGGSFGALKKDGSVVTWGHLWEGGDSRNVQSKLYDIEDIIGSRRGGIAALRKDGMAIVWGLGRGLGIQNEDVTYEIPNISKLVFLDNALFIGIDKNETVVVQSKANIKTPLEDLEVQLAGGIKKALSIPSVGFVFLKEDHSLVLLSK